MLCSSIEMTEECSFEDLYAWVDNIPLSRRKKNISRDFSDAVMLAEILKYYFPRWVDLHNYPSVNSKSAKVRNWEILNKKVLQRLKIPVSDSMILDLSSATPGAAEELLQIIRDKVDEITSRCIESLPRINNLKEETVPTYEEIIKTLDEYRRELLEKEDVIITLKEDIVHLNGLLKLKEQRIADLSAQLKRAGESIRNCITNT